MTRFIEKNGNRIEVGYCCYVGCDKPAEFEIQKEHGSPLDDFTNACEDHVGSLLMDGANRVTPHLGKCPTCGEWCSHDLHCKSEEAASIRAQYHYVDGVLLPVDRIT